jgi:hypothetical protein
MVELTIDTQEVGRTLWDEGRTSKNQLLVKLPKSEKETTGLVVWE